MKRKSLYTLLSIAFICIGLYSCGPSQKESISVELVTVAEGPFFAGPNSLMANYQPNLKELLSDASIKLEDIQRVSIEKVTVKLIQDTLFNMEAFNSASLQFVSDNLPMTSVAILNPIESSGTTIDLIASDEADVTELFKEDQLTAVLDLEFIEDSYEDMLETELFITINVEY